MSYNIGQNDLYPQVQETILERRYLMKKNASFITLNGPLLKWLNNQLKISPIDLKCARSEEHRVGKEFLRM